MGRVTAMSWTARELGELASARVLEVSAPRADGSYGPWTPIWVVVVDSEVFVRTWHRRETGWYGRAVRHGRLRIRVAGEPVDVLVEVVGDANADAVDAAYRDKYGTGGAQSMTTPEAVAATLRLVRASFDI